MKRIFCASVLVTASWLALIAAPASAQDTRAQVKCPEGKTATGDCVNPALAAALRLTAMIFSQPKSSQTAFPILPADDYSYRYPHQLIPTPLKPAPAFAPSP